MGLIKVTLRGFTFEPNNRKWWDEKENKKHKNFRNIQNRKLESLEFKKIGKKLLC